jgi:hypothetical protein
MSGFDYYPEHLGRRRQCGYQRHDAGRSGMKRITYTNPDGSCSVVIPHNELFDPTSPLRTLLPELNGKTDDEILKWEMNRAVPKDATDVNIIEEEDVPKKIYPIEGDHTFSYREAWRQSAGKISHDMNIARNIHMDKIRKIRDVQLRRVSIRDWMKATGQKKQKDADDIETQRQALRDLPQTFDLTKAQTVDDLKVMWPPNLPRKI